MIGLHQSIGSREELEFIISQLAVRYALSLDVGPSETKWAWLDKATGVVVNAGSTDTADPRLALKFAVEAMIGRGL